MYNNWDVEYIHARDCKHSITQPELELLYAKILFLNSSCRKKLIELGEVSQNKQVRARIMETVSGETEEESNWEALW